METRGAAYIYIYISDIKRCKSIHIMYLHHLIISDISSVRKINFKSDWCRDCFHFHFGPQVYNQVIFNKLQVFKFISKCFY